MYGYICPGCGDHLDPGEKCERCEENRKEKEALDSLMITEDNGQMIFKEASA